MKLDAFDEFFERYQKQTEIVLPTQNDPVTAPAHYVKGNIEPIDLIDAMDLDFYQGNILKYIVRWKDKGGVEDLKKAMWYLERYINNNEKAIACA